MEFIDVVRGRRSIREFADVPVSRQNLEAILEAACWAPSAQNLQPWYFQVLTSEEDVNWLYRELNKTAPAHRLELEARFSNHPQVVEDTLAFMERMGGAKTVVLAYLNKPSYNDDVKDSAVQSVAAAMENLCLAAYDRGIGSCWVEYVTRIGDRVRERFAPEHGRLIGAIMLGYPTREQRVPRRKAGRYEIR